MLLIGTAAVSLCLSSCVVPYENYGTGQPGYTSYQNGYRVTTLPSGYRSENISGSTYYYHNGHYYRQSNNGYIVTEAPRSSRYYSDYDHYRQTRTTTYSGDRQTYNQREYLSRLPSNYRSVDYRGQQYYKSGDRYYVREDGRYYVVSRPY
jgi:hypothetical protein